MRNFFMAVSALCISASAFADWSYNESEDKMTGKKTKTAKIVSDNSLSLDFPYTGDNYGVLVVRKHPQYGTNVIISIQKGQFLCSSYEGCQIQVRFDDAPPVKFSGVRSADHDSTYIFFQNENRFINNAKKAKKILVQANIYKSGAPVMEFSTIESLKWESPAQKQKK